MTEEAYKYLALLFEQAPNPEYRAEFFSLELFLYEFGSNLLNAKGTGIEEVYFGSIDILCKKIDVVKRLDCFYDRDTFLSIRKQPINQIYEIILCVILLLFSDFFDDYKFINSSLKLMDMLNARGFETPEIFKAYSNKLLFELPNRRLNNASS